MMSQALIEHLTARSAPVHKRREVLVRHTNEAVDYVVEIVTPRWLFLECQRKNRRIRPYVQRPRFIR